MTKKATFLMCSPRKKQSGSYSLGNYFCSLLKEKGAKVDYFQIYQTLKSSDKLLEMVDSINRSEIIILSTPLYIDQAPYMTIKLMDEITTAIENGKIEEKKRILIVIVCAGFLEYYHNNVALNIYKNFASRNNFTWAGGFPIGAASTYTLYPVPKLIEMCSQLPEDDPREQMYGRPARDLDSVMKVAAENLIQGKTVPEEELKKLDKVYIPLDSYVQGGNQQWLNAAKELGTEEKLRDKPYD